MKLADLRESIKEAHRRIEKFVLRTPLLYSKPFSHATGAEVYLKLESEQITGSFKARGSLNRLLTLSKTEKQSGALTASTGNHALGMAHALELTGMNGQVYLPLNASPTKVARLQEYSIEIHFHGNDSLETETYARQMAHEQDRVWVSPYNDLAVIAGQGTVGLEIAEQIPQMDAVLVTMGGGGLIAGIGAYLQGTDPRIEIIGCQPENSPEMILSLQQGKVVESYSTQPTLSDGSAGGLEADAITFPICQQVVKSTVQVNEESIARGIRRMADYHHKMIEGAAAVPIAALFQVAQKYRGKRVVLVICGSNIDPKLYAGILHGKAQVG